MRKIRVMEMIDKPFLGGGQMTLLSLAKHLDREKFEVFICSELGGPMVDEVQRSGIPHYPTSFSKKFRLGTVGKIAAILKQNKIDLLHTHGGIAGFYGRWAGRRARIPVIVHTLHGIHYLHYRNFFLKQLYIILERRFSRFTDAVIFVSDSDAGKARERNLVPEKKIFIIKNGLDFQDLKQKVDVVAKKRELAWSDRGPIIGTVARLHRQKGIIYFLRASRRILREIPEAKIVVVGGGPLENHFRRAVQKLGFEGRFLIMGERSDARELLSLFDIFVLPSLWEGLPYVLAEAAALGKKIVATDVDGVREVIRDGETGVLIPPKNPEALAEAILRLLQEKDYAAKLGKQAQELIPGQFAISRMVEETERLYFNLYRQSTSY